MTSIIISGKDKKDVEAIALIAKKIGVNVHHIDIDQTEDLMMGAVMKKSKTNKKVSRNVVMQNLLQIK